MSRLLSLVLSAGLALGVGCEEVRVEQSDIQHQKAKVVSKVYSPSVYSSIPVEVGNITINIDTSSPEEYLIEFDGELDFSVDNKEIFSRFEEGEEAWVAYQQITKNFYQDVDKDGKKDLISSRESYHFIDAVPTSWGLEKKWQK